MDSAPNIDATSNEGARMRVKLDSINTPCFPADTLVWTNIGEREMRFIGVGDLVLSRCEFTGETAYKRVTRVIETEEVLYYDVVYQIEGFDFAVNVSSTANHPFWVEGKGWVAVAQLQENDLLCLQDGTFARFIKRREGFEIDVYNLEVEDFHTYFVGHGGVWVHNECSSLAHRYDSA